MSWKQWVLIGLIAFSTLVSITQVGKPRKPLEPGTAAILVVINGVLVWLIATI